MICRPGESIWPCSLWKALGNFAGVRCWQISAVILQYLCTEICVRVRSVKSQPYAVCVRFRQYCRLLFIFYINLIHSHSRVDDGVTFGIRRIGSRTTATWTTATHETGLGQFGDPIRRWDILAMVVANVLYEKKCVIEILQWLNYKGWLLDKCFCCHPVGQWPVCFPFRKKFGNV